MSPKQIELMGLIDRILSAVNGGNLYRQLRTTIDGDNVFIEDVITHVYFHTGRHGTIFDMERRPEGNSIVSWNETAALEMMDVLENHYVLQLIADL